MTKDRESRFSPVAAGELTVETRMVEEVEVRTVVGYGSVFDRDSEDMGFIEQIAPGAFAEAIPISDVRALFNHQPDNILGRNVSGTLRLKEDKVGLRYELDLPDTNLGRDLSVSIERGDITGNSFSFTVAEDEWDHEAEPVRRRITRVGELFDVGPVTYPAYPDATISARALEMSQRRPEKRNNLETYERAARLREIDDPRLTEDKP